MPLTSVIITLAVIGLLLWLLNTYGTAIDPKIKSIINIVVVIVIVLWLLRIFGIMGSMSALHT